MYFITNMDCRSIVDSTTGRIVGKGTTLADAIRIRDALEAAAIAAKK